MISFSRPPHAVEPEKAKPKKWKRTRFIVGGPVASIGLPEISQGRNFISTLLAVFKGRSARKGPIQMHENGRINLVTTAILLGLSEEELKQRFHETRLSSARSAYALCVLGGLFFVLWIYDALHMPFMMTRIVSALEFLPFCALFFILAFRFAWTNWQLRTMRLGSASAYLRTTDPFWPQ
jgi:hypothetical protein